MRKRQILALVIFSVCFYSLNAQVSKKGRPKSFNQAGLVSSAVLPEITFAGVNKAALLKEDEQQSETGRPFRFGVPFNVSYSLKNSGKWDNLSNGDRIWRLVLKSQGAYSINLIFNQYKLPKDAELYIYNQTRTMVLGAFTSDNNQADGKFGVQPVKGDEIVVEYFEPASERGKGVIEIGEVIHAYRDIFDEAYGFGNSLSCHVNINCSQGAAWQDEKRSVALIVAGGGLCSGALINNTAQDGKPYLLTADHCFSGSVSTWVYVFNYESSDCSNTEGPTNNTVSGSTLRARYSDSDFLLVELNSIPPASYNVYYSGWSRATAAPSSVAGIHHPAGDIKKISTFSSAPATASWSSIPNHWSISGWTYGTTEGGSSGSPLFDHNGRIVGQLHGGTTPACPGSGKTSLYGKFDYSWNTGSTSDQKLQPWLDPTNSGVTTLDGADLSTLVSYCASASSSTADGLISNVSFGTISNVSGTTCNSYSDYTAQSTNLSPGANVSLTITPGTCGVDNSKVIKVFIDWNGDMDFSDSGELVATSGVLTGTTPYATTVAVPATIVTGSSSRMRIVCMETTTASSVAACGTYPKGETEDYTVNFVPGTTYVVPSTGSNSVTTCSGVLYDHGGASSNYADNVNGRITINPATAGGKVSLTFTSFSIEDCCDYFYIYNGTSTAAPLLGTYTANPGTVYATGASGALTIQFISDGSVNYSGFSANISCVTSVPAADLTIQSPSATPASAAAGGYVSLGCTIYNQGGLSASSSNIGYYLSTDNTWSASDVFLGTSSGATLANGATALKSASLLIPSSTATGSYYILFFADYQSQVSESDETNNVQAYGISVVSPSVDLIIQNPTVSPSTSILAGTLVSLDCSIYNQGNTASTSSNVGYYYSTDNVWDASDVLMGSSSGGTLNNGSSSNKLITLSIPASATAGTRYILFFADYTSGVTESNETNNVSYVAVTIQNGYLMPCSSSSTINTCSGTIYDNGGMGNYSSYCIGTMVVNPGVAGSYVRLDFTSFQTATYDYLYIYNGTSSSAPLLGTYSGTVSPGVVYGNNAAGALTLVFDTDGYPYAGFTATISCVSSIPAGDLRITNTTLSSSTVVAGANISLTNYVQNTGGASVSSSSTGYYLSADTIFDAGDVNLGVSTGGTLNGGASSYKSASVQIPFSAATGAQYVLFVADHLQAVTEPNELDNVVYRAITVNAAYVDLAITSPYLSYASIAYGGTTNATCYIVNQGTTISGTSNIGFYLSSDNVWDASDVYLANSAGGNLSASSSSYRNVALTIPLATAVGNYYILYHADYQNSVPETNETNNVSSVAISVVVPSVDLLPRTVSASPTSLMVGAPMSVSCRVKNQGTTLASSSSLGYYLSFDNQFDATDILLSSTAVGTLFAGDSILVSGTFNMSSAATPGAYYLLFYADHQNANSEIVETNNVMAMAITIQNGYVVPLSSTATITTCSGTVYDHAGTSSYSNYANGTLTINPSVAGNYIRLSFTSFSVETCCDYLYIYDGTSTSAPLLGTYTSNPGVVYASSSSGALTLRFYADGSITSSGFEAAISCVSTIPLSDLTVTSPYLSTAAAPSGTSASVSCIIQNIGLNGASSSAVGYYLSSDAVWDASDVLVGSGTGASLVSGASSSRSGTINIPSTTVPGSYYVIYVVDHLNALTEDVETNNTVYLPFSVLSPVIDLYTQSQYLSSTSIPAGSSVTTSCYIYNQGNVASLSSNVGYYLSVDNSWDATDVLLGNSTGGSLSSGGSSYRSASLLVPSSTAPGNYYILYFSDFQSSVSESNEANNIAYLNVTVLAPIIDLLIQTPTISSLNVANGGQVSVSSYIANQGNVAASSSTVGYYLSTNNTWDAADTYLNYSTGSSLSANATSVRSQTLTIPAATALGSYYLLYFADYANAVSENNETNNVVAIAFNVVTPTIDLLPVHVTATPQAVIPGSSITLNCWMKNQGSTYSTANSIGYYLSTNNTLDAGDTFLSSYSVSAQNGGDSTYASRGLTISSGLTTGTYYILLVADYLNGNSETNELNNIVTVPISVTTAYTVPLSSTSSITTCSGVVYDHAGTSNYSNSANGTLTIYPGVAGNYVRLTFNSFNTESCCDYLYIYNGTSTSAALIGTYYGSNSPGVVYATNASGALTLRFYTDGSVVSSGFEAAISCVSSLPTADLKMQTPTISPNTVAAGGTTAVSAYILNAGATTASSSYVGYYLSTDTIYTAADIYLGYSSGSSLSAGASSYRGSTVTIPFSTSVGSYYVLLVADYTNSVIEDSETNNTRYISLAVVAPVIDLTIQSPSVALSVVPSGGSTSVSCTISNQGNSTSVSSNVGYYLSTDNVWDASDVYLTYSSGSSLSAGATSTRSATITIPSSTAVGNYYLLYLADYSNSVAEGNETNNVNAAVISVVAPTVDLYVQSPSLSPLLLPPGNSTSVSCNIYNQGNSSASSSSVGYYLSADNVWDASDVYLNYSAGSSLAPGTSSYRSSTLTIPAATATGLYYILFYADHQNSVSESNETNNLVVLSISVVPAVVDLVINNQSLNNTSTVAGGTNYASCYIYNQGNSVAATSNVGFYLSTNTTWDASDVYLSNSTGGSVNGGGSSTRGASIIIPASTVPGTYYVLYYADYLNGVSESNEGNNVNAVMLTVTAPTYDLNPQSAYASPTSVSAGASVSVSSYFYNLGNVNVSNARMGYYLSANTAWDASDVFLTFATATSISAGSYTYMTGTVVIPAGTPIGGYYVLFYGDDQGSVSESNETNNVAYSPISIVTPTIDLNPQSAYASPSSISAEASASVSCYLYNLGNTNASSVRLGYYLSSNSTWDASDVFLTSSTTSSVTAGSYSYLTSSVAIPSGTPAGGYYILFYADDQGGMSESNEINNVAYYYISVTSPTIDLSPQSAYSSSTSLAAGTSTSVSSYVYNLGNTYYSGSARLGYYLSTNSTWDASDVFLSYSTINAISSGSYSYTSGSVTIPAGTATGYYYLLYFADYQSSVSESNETNNVASVYISVVTPSVDFYLQSTYLSSYSIAPGSSVSASTYLYNLGNTTSGSTRVGYYLSANSTWSASDVFLGYSSVSSVNTSSSNYVTGTATIPASTAPGNYYIVFFVDDLSGTSETNETNNVASISLTILAPSVDLTVNSMYLSSTSVIAGGTTYASCYLYNQGSTTASSSSAGFYLSTNATWDASDVFLSSLTGGSLASGYSIDRSTTLTIPASTAPGNYYVLFYADYANLVGESNETNNVGYIAITVTSTSVDLVVQSPSSAGSAAVGGSLAVSCYVYNQGTAAASSSHMGYYLSTDMVYDASDSGLLYAYGASVSGLTSSYRNTNVTIPSWVGVGNYYLLLFVDYSGSISENNENNNVVSIPISVTGSADLAVYSASVTGIITSGIPFFAQGYIYNLGANTVSASALGYYLSNNSTWDASDILIGTQAVGSIASGSNVFVNTTLTASVSPGTYYVIFKADSPNSIIETSETNNYYAYQVSIITDISEAYEGGGLELYPNPNDGQFNVKVPSLQNGRITVVNTLGEEVWQEEYMTSEEFVTINLHDRNVAAGVYTVKISAGDKFWTELITVVK